MIAGELSVVVVMGVVDGRSLGGRWIGVREGERVKAGWSVRLRQQRLSARRVRRGDSSTMTCCCSASFLETPRWSTVRVASS